jgi:hypothetical protein
MRNARSLVERQLGELCDHADGHTYCRCPGAALHAKPSGKRDTRVYFAAGSPTIHCLHSSCAANVQAANRALRSALGQLDRGLFTTVDKFVKSPEQIARERDQARATDLANTAKNALPSILHTYPWPAAQIWTDSPAALIDGPAEDWRRLLGLYQPDDYLWIGDKKDSGNKRHKAHFRTAEKWLLTDACPKGPYICPAVFQAGCWSRSKENVAGLPFMVIESDILSKDQIGAVFRWLRETVGLHLRAVVDTGRRSLHGWFDYPDDDTVRDLGTVLPPLQCDGAVLRSNQPCRLPGCFRADTGATQALLYFDRGAAS